MSIVTIFDSHDFEKETLKKAFHTHNIQITFLADQLNKETAFLTLGSDAVCCFVNDNVDRTTIDQLRQNQVKLIL